jgi:hypothetical protein
MGKLYHFELPVQSAYRGGLPEFVFGKARRNFSTTLHFRRVTRSLVSQLAHHRILPFDNGSKRLLNGAKR